jgi:glycerol uptake facilitator-like aquaporin
MMRTGAAKFFGTFRLVLGGCGSAALAAASGAGFMHRWLEPAD